MDIDWQAIIQNLWAEHMAKLTEFYGDLETPWDIVARNPGILDDLAKRDLRGEVHPTAVVEGEVLLEEGASIGPHAYVMGPTIIRAGATVRHGAFVRNHCLLEEGAGIGHASEAKNAILLPGAQAPHFAYVGDSVLGAKCNLGAGTKLANLRIVPGNVAVRIGEERIDTGLRKFGALIGNRCQVGCNTVLSPGTILEADCVVFPGLSVRGFHPKEAVVR
jgi:NDP-sugar pyrophosphorylase family protein